MGWPVKRAFTKCTQKINEKGGKSEFPKNGDLATDDSTQLSAYIKSLANKEMFQYFTMNLSNIMVTK